jgi:pimeloyl-ACP methyl ester carboxylesterase
MIETKDQEVTLWQGEVVTSVRIAGEGKPLVFLHGEHGLQWDPLLDSLAKSYRVYAPLHPGTDGKHPDAVRALRTLSDLVICYDEMFEALRLDHAVVVGHGFGAMVAAEIAAAYPKFVDRLVLICPFGLWRDDAPVGNPDAAAMHMWTTGCTGHYLWPLSDKGLGKRIHRIQAPSLVVWGRKDGIVPAVYADEFGRRIKNAKVEIIENAGHVPHLEQPEAVTKVVGQFLRA